MYRRADRRFGGGGSRDEPLPPSSAATLREELGNDARARGDSRSRPRELRRGRRHTKAFHILRVSSHPAKQVVADECSLAFQQLGRFSKTLLFIGLKGSTTEVSKEVEHQSQMVVGGANDDVMKIVNGEMKPIEA